MEKASEDVEGVEGVKGKCGSFDSSAAAESLDMLFMRLGIASNPCSIE